MINTYGFGYDIKSELLDMISGIGWTVFLSPVGILDNIVKVVISIRLAHYEPKLNITVSNGLQCKNKQPKVNTLQYGQDRHIYRY